jgi:hypothetical protein
VGPGDIFFGLITFALRSGQASRCFASEADPFWQHKAGREPPIFTRSSNFGGKSGIQKLNLVRLNGTADGKELS